MLDWNLFVKPQELWNAISKTYSNLGNSTQAYEIIQRFDRPSNEIKE